MNSEKYYNFVWPSGRHVPDIKSIIHLIAQQGEGIVGMELGVCKCDSFVAVLQACKNVKTLYGIDKWEPYSDYLVSNDLNRPDYTNTQKDAEFFELISRHRVKWSGEEHRAKLIKKDSDEAVKDFPDEFFDFIFVDTYLTYEQVKNDLELWYPKVKKGGLFCGHDYDAETVQRAVAQFRYKHNINNYMSIYDSTFVWRK